MELVSFRKTSQPVGVLPVEVYPPEDKCGPHPHLEEHGEPCEAAELGPLAVLTEPELAVAAEGQDNYEDQEKVPSQQVNQPRFVTTQSKIACVTTPKVSGESTPHRMNASANAAETQNSVPTSDLSLCTVDPPFCSVCRSAHRRLTFR
jgi:hypothetical protein